MKSKRVIYYLIFGVVFALFNLLAFVIPTNKTATFWIAYAFTVIAFAFQIALREAVLRKDESVKSLFLGISVLHVGVVYLAVQVIALAVFMAFPGIPAWITIILNAIIIAAAIICSVSAGSAVSEINRIEKKAKEKRFFVQSSVVEVEMLAEREDDPAVKAALNKLADSIRYSDPMSDDLLAPLEAKITAAIAKIEAATDKEKAIREVELLLIERNKKCKLLK